MAERSGFWTNGSGDGHPYSQDEFRTFLKWIHRNPAANEGLYHGQLNELVVTSPGNNQIKVDTGRALVDGMFYEHDDDQTLNVSSPSTGTTGKRVVLRKSWSARTVRIAIISSADGTATLPALTQTDGATWEIPIASFTITTGGVIGSLTDEREWLPDALGDLHGVDLSGAESGDVLVFDGTDWVVGAGPAWIFGNGSDGDVTITSPNHVDLARDMYYDTLTVNAGATLDTNGFRVFCRTAAIVNGTITNVVAEDGNPATAAPSGTLGTGGAGGNGSTAKGGAGGPVVLVVAPSITGSGVIHADGAGGGGSAASGAGAGGTATAPEAAKGGTQVLNSIPQILTLRTLDGERLNGGGGGGGNSAAGGSVTNALGGSGGNKASSTVTGYNGGGGLAVTLTLQEAASCTVRAAAGTGGGGGTAGAGTAIKAVLANGG